MVPTDVVHARSVTNGEYTLCGMAFDINELYGKSGEENYLSFANDGEAVTCSECREVIRACRKMRINKAHKSGQPID